MYVHGAYIRERRVSACVMMMMAARKIQPLSLPPSLSNLSCSTVQGEPADLTRTRAQVMLTYAADDWAALYLSSSLPLRRPQRSLLSLSLASLTDHACSTARGGGAAARRRGGDHRCTLWRRELEGSQQGRNFEVLLLWWSLSRRFCYSYFHAMQVNG